MYVHVSPWDIRCVYTYLFARLCMRILNLSPFNNQQQQQPCSPSPRLNQARPVYLIVIELDYYGLARESSE